MKNKYLLHNKIFNEKFFNYKKIVLLKVTHSKNLINFKSFKINEDGLKIHFVLFARTTFRMINYLRSKDFLDFFGLTTDFKAKELDFKPSCHYSLKYKS